MNMLTDTPGVWYWNLGRPTCRCLRLLETAGRQFASPRTTLFSEESYRKKFIACQINGFKVFCLRR